MKLSDFLVEEIYRLTKTDKIFGYIGGMIAHIVDGIAKRDDVEMVNTITEQGAGFAAEGYARATGRLGVAIATSGPGATNLVTPIANCFFDSSPVLFITGQVNTFEYQKYPIRQCGFQEANIVDVVKPIVKYAKMITRAEDVRVELQKAIHIAMDGRKGPVLLDIPIDIQRIDVDVDALASFRPDAFQPSKLTWDASILKKFKRPLLLAGNGVNLSGATATLAELLEKWQIPVVQSLLGIDCVRDSYPYNLGLIGSYGNRHANLALYDADLLLVLGSRLDLRQTGSSLAYLKGKTIVQVDVDGAELGCDKIEKIAVQADVKEFITRLLNLDASLGDIEEWRQTALRLKGAYARDSRTYAAPNRIMSELFDAFKESDKIAVDVGQNQMWAAQSAKIKAGQRLLNSGGFGSMGFALPCAIGACFSGDRAIAITGDGGLQMNIQELEVVKRRNLPIKILVFNNRNLGMIRVFQELYCDHRYASTMEDYSAPDFAKVARAYGIEAITIAADEFDIKKIESVLNADGPALIDIVFDPMTKVEPRLAFGLSIEKANPAISDAEIRAILNK